MAMAMASHIERRQTTHAESRHVIEGVSPDQKLHLFLTRSILALILTTAAAIWLAVGLSAAAADDVPAFDISKTCKVDTSAYPMPDGNAGCLKDEQSARQTLATSWAGFDEQSRRNCMQMVGDVTGTQSYVELLTCLEMAAETKRLPNR